MLTDEYVDQPYCLLHAGSWVCTITRSSIGREGGAGIHVEALTSADDGATWVSHNLDPTNTSSYSALTQTRFGRWVVLFGLQPPHAPHGFATRASDDGGATWGPTVAVPLRHTAIDGNGTTADSWTVDRITVSKDDVATLALTKYSGPMMAPEEVFLLSSPNLLTERNASAVTWATLPEGPRGLEPPGGAPGVMEEGHVVPLASGGCFMVARTEQGYLAAARTAEPSCAGGWTDTAFARYWSATPLLTNRALKNPRGPVQLKRMANGRYLLLFYYNSAEGFKNRNPYWVSAGVEESGEVRFSEPELALLEWADESQRPGYPDIVEDASTGAVAFTETNKTHARIHPVPAAFLALLYAQDTAATVAPGAASVFTAADVNATLPSPPLPDFGACARSLTVGVWLAPKYDGGDGIRGSSAAPPGTLMDTRAAGAGPGLRITASPLTPGGGALNVSISDAAGRGAWVATDAPCTTLLTAGGAAHYFAVVLDAAAHVLTVLVDGVLCDGGMALEQGWAWVPPDVADVTGAATFVLAPSFHGDVLRGHFYHRALLTSELVGNYRAGPGAL